MRQIHTNPAFCILILKFKLHPQSCNRASLNLALDNDEHMTRTAPHSKRMQVFPTPLTTVVKQKKRQRKAAEGEVIIKWNVFIPFASSNSRGTF